MKKRTFATVLGTALTVTTIGLGANPASAQIARGYSSYYVQHFFNVNFGGNNAPNLLGAAAFGSASCVNPFISRSYNDTDIGFPAVSASGSSTVNCRGAAAQASSIAQGTVAANFLTGTTLARGWASAVAPPGGAARARSSAALTAGQLGINPFGQITWRPLFWSYVSGDAFAFAAARPRDPIAYTISDPTTGEILLEGKLLDISADFDGFGSTLEWGATQSPTTPGDEPENPVEDNQLDINFVNNGFLKIDLTDPAVSNPGLFDLACEAGRITRFVTEGRFAGLTGLPSVGQSCNFSIPFSTIFPEEIALDYNFSGLIPTTEVNLNFDLGGDGDAVASVPEPTSILSILALGGIGATSTLKRKLKPSTSTKK